MSSTSICRRVQRARLSQRGSGLAAGGANLLLKPLPSGLAEDRLTLEQGLIFKQGHYHESPVMKRSLTLTGGAAVVTLAVPFRTEKPQVSVERLPVRQHGELLSVQEATALRIVMGDRVDDICLYHKSVDVTSYLDHTGNIISEALLPARRSRRASRLLEATITGMLLSLAVIENSTARISNAPPEPVRGVAYSSNIRPRSSGDSLGQVLQYSPASGPIRIR